MKLGYIGYGEAAYAISGGLAQTAGVEQYAWSRTFSYKGKPEEVGAVRTSSIQELLERCDTIFVTTPNTAARSVAEQAAPCLHEGIVYVDLTSSSPKLMEEVAGLVEPTGALFVDGAMLDSLPKFRHKVKTVVSGNGADELLQRVGGLGMNLEKVGDKPGAASSIKMLRSLYTKAHLGFAFEMLEGAAAYGVEDYVMNSLAETMDQKNFISGMDGRLCGGVIHAGRRAVELEMAADMLRDAGLDDQVARAAAAKLRKVGQLNLKEKLGDYRPKTWKEALDCLTRFKE